MTARELELEQAIRDMRAALRMSARTLRREEVVLHPETKGRLAEMLEMIVETSEKRTKLTEA